MRSSLDDTELILKNCIKHDVILDGVAAVRQDWNVLDATKVLGAFEEFEWALCIRQNFSQWEMAV